MKEDMYVDRRRWTVLITEVLFLLVLGIRNCIDLWIFSLHWVCGLHHCRTGGTSTADLVEQLPVRAPVLEVCQVGGKIQVIFNILLKINTLTMLFSNTKSLIYVLARVLSIQTITFTVWS